MMATGDESGEGFASDVKLSRKAAKRAKANPNSEQASVPVSGGGGGSGGMKSTATGTKVVATVSSSVAEEAGPKSDADAAKKAIEDMEKAEAGRLAERQARIDSVLEAREATEDDPTAGVIPQVVADRMLKRMGTFFLFPVLCGLAIFVGVYVLSHQYDYTIPAYIVAYATQFPFVVAVAGTTYAIISASWDEEREGSFLGTEEAARNLGIIRDGLRRSSDAMDVEDIVAAQERETRQANRYERRKMKKEESGDV